MSDSYLSRVNTVITTQGAPRGDSEGFDDVPPVIAGTVAGQEIVDKQTVTPFSEVTISDDASASLTVTVTLSDASQGTLSNLGTGAYDPFAGEYLVTGTAAQVSAALEQLVFTPTIQPGVTETTTFAISVDDGLAPPVTDSNTTVLVTSDNSGGGEIVTFTGAPGYAASLYGRSNGWYDVIASSVTVYLNGVAASVVGEDMLILLTGFNDISLYNTNGHWDTVSGSFANITMNGAQASLIGAAYNITFVEGTVNSVSFYGASNPNNGDTVYGSSGTLILDDATVQVIGVNDTVYFTDDSKNVVQFLGPYNLASGWDTVVGASSSVTLMHAQASVFGASNAISFSDMYADDAVSLYQTSGSWDTVQGNNGAVTLNGAQTSVSGQNDSIYFSSDAGNAVSLYNTNNHWDAVRGSNGVVTLNGAQTSVVGGGDYVYFAGADASAVSFYQSNGAADYVFGSNGVVTLNDAQASVSGNHNDVYLNGFFNTLAFPQAIGTATVHGFGFDDVIAFSKADFADFSALHPVQQGDDTVIALDADDSVTLKNVTAANLKASQFSFV